MAAQRPTAKRAPSAVEQAALNGIKTWAKFTLAKDTQPTRVKRINHVAANWLGILLTLLLWAALAQAAPIVPAALTLIGLTYLIGRGVRWLPKRQKALSALYASTTKACGHPRASRAIAIDHTSRLAIKHWATPTIPGHGYVAFEPDSPAGDPATQWTAEKSLETVAGEGHDMIFDYTAKPGWIGFTRVKNDDPRITQKKANRWVNKAIADLFPQKRGAADIVHTESEFEDDNATYASTITVTYPSNFDPNDRSRRTEIERGFDSAVYPPGVHWVYNWETRGTLIITAHTADSGEAVRKANTAKIRDVAVGAITRAAGGTAGKQADITVTGWVPEESTKGTPNTPTAITITLGTADLSNIGTQRQIEAALDQALENEWGDRIWLYDWTFGARTTLAANAVPRNHAEALRKHELRRMRDVVGQKFKVARGSQPIDVDVVEWKTDDEGIERAQKAVVNFGTYDVQKPDTRREFQNQFDSLVDGNDWQFDWDPPRGRLGITAVPPLPRYLPFPDEGSPEAERWHSLFRSGKILLGPAKGGYEAIIDLSKSPHMLVGGSTGAGKSVLLGLFLYGALMNPDHIELVTIDPKISDWTFAGPNYPGVRALAPLNAVTSIEEVNVAIKIAYDEMVRRQNLCKQWGAENLDEMRRLASEGRIGIRPEDIPKRMILFFDEGGSAFTPTKNADLKAIQDDSRTMMEQVCMLARAFQVNVCLAAQKPSAENIGTAMREQLVNRIGIGYLNTATSIQVMGNTLCSELDQGSPKGRGYFVDDQGRELMIQTFYLPKRSQPDPINPTKTVQGIIERVADLLDGLGYSEVQVPQQLVVEDPDTKEMKTITTMVTQWVRPDRIG